MRIKSKEKPGSIAIDKSHKGNILVRSMFVSKQAFLKITFYKSTPIIEKNFSIKDP